MFRLLLTLALLALSALAAPAGDHWISVTSDHPGEVYLRPTKGGPWKLISDHTPATPDVDPDEAPFDVRVVGENHNILWHWTGTRSKVWPKDLVVLECSLEMDPGRLRVAGIAGIAVLALGAGAAVVWSQRRTRQARAAVESTEHYVRKLEGRGGDPIRFGPYRVVRRLGHGGMAKVFEVVDQYDVHYAVKTPTVDDEERREDVLARFEREFKILSSFKHPGIVKIHDYRPDCEEHQAFLVMELIEGDTLEQRLKLRGRLPVKDAVAIGRQVLQVLAYCHARGIVHRDLTPGNVFLIAGGGVKVVDFGISKDLNLAMTRTGVTLGTPFYSAPEQIEGKWVTERTDLFAVGILLYQMLTGTIPHSEIKDVTKFYMKRAGGVEKSPREVNPAISPELSDAVMKLLETDPARRPANAEAALELL